MNEGNEISLKELILILLHDFKNIIVVTFTFTILAIIVTLSLPKTYQAQSQITFNLPLVNSSRFGEYTFSSQKVSDYLTLLYSDEVKNEVVEVTQIASSNFKIQVDLDNESTIALIKTTSNNPDIAKKVNDVLIDTYIMKLRLQYKIDAIDRFIYT